MIYEMRTYRTHVHEVPAFISVYHDRGIAIISRYATLVGSWYTEIGTLNEIVFIWAYKDFNHRMEQRRKLWSDEEWIEFVPSIRRYMAHQESVILMPTAFSPLQ